MKVEAKRKMGRAIMLKGGKRGTKEQEGNIRLMEGRQGGMYNEVNQETKENAGREILSQGGK